MDKPIVKRTVGTPIERFFNKIERHREDHCWQWIGFTDAKGYGAFGDGEGVVRAHRFAYEHFVAPIPDGLQIDHLCRNTSCVNPLHLQPVTAKENTHRAPTHSGNRTHCRYGHEFTPENTKIVQRKRGTYRSCRACFDAKIEKRRAASLAWYYNNKEHAAKMRRIYLDRVKAERKTEDRA